MKKPLMDLSCLHARKLIIPLRVIQMSVPVESHIPIIVATLGTNLHTSSEFHFCEVLTVVA